MSPVWLAEVVIDGAVFRYATRAIDVTLDGESHHYKAGLQPLAINLRDIAQREEVRIAIDEMDVSALDIQRGSLLTGDACTLRWHRPNGRTITVFNGNAVGADTSKLGRVQLQLKRDLSLPLWPPARLSISDKTHPITGGNTLKLQNSFGAEPYPITVGASQGTRNLLAFTGIWFAPIASYDEKVVAPGTGTVDVVIHAGPVQATTANLSIYIGDVLTQIDALPITLETDLLGQPVSMVKDVGDLGGSTYLFSNEDAPEIYFSFPVGQGGMSSTLADGAAHGVADVVLSLLDSWAPDQTLINRDDLYLNREQFNRYKVSFQKLSQVKGDSLLHDLFALVPCLSIPTDKGRAYRFINFYATAADAVRTITEGAAGVTRRGSFAHKPKPIVNALQVTYGAPSPRNADPARSPTVDQLYFSSVPSDAEDHPISSTASHPPAGSGPVALSRAIIKREATLEIPITLDAETIRLVARDTFRARAFNARWVVLQVPAQQDENTPGDVVLFTSSELSVTAEPYIVWDVQLGLTQHTLTLRSVNGRPTPLVAA